MERVLALYAGRAFLGGRAAAHRVRTEAERILKLEPGSVVVLNFDRVQGVSHSFGDELLSPLADALGARVADRVTLANCSNDVLEDLKSIARMHRLPMPSADRGNQIARVCA